jgi:RNA polymerase sigma-70 factor (ECF subfamily)
MNETRSSLLRRVRNPADAESWAEFVALYEPLLLKYVRAQGLQESDVRDVVQDVLLGLVRTLPNFELDRSKGRFRTWLWRVTRNAIAARARREQLRDRAEECYQPSQEAAEPEEWSRSYRTHLLQAILERVRGQTQPRSWACFEQHLLHGRPAGEVARELDLTAGAVYVNSSRVLAQVRQQCADFLEDLHDI